MHTALITRIATDARGVWAATVSIDKTARVWEVATRKQVAVLRPPQDVGPEGKLYAVAMSPDAVEVAVAGWTGYDWDGQSAIYVFDRASGRMVRRLPALPNAVNHLAYSPDGRWLAAALGGGNGVRVFDAKTGRQTGSDERYGADSLSAHFSPDSKRLLTSCFDGQLRRYDVEDGRLGVPRRAQLQGAQTLLGARFSPGPGRLIAVGFLDSTNVVVLDAESLQEVARPGTVGMNNISLNSLAWSADGAFLVAAGRSRSAELSSMRRWRVSDWSPLGDVVLSRDTVMDLVPLPSGEVLFASADPTWGVVDSAGGVRRQPSAKGDLRGNDRLALSADGRRVGFNYGSPGWESGGFDLVSRSLGGEPPTALARTSAPGLEVENWRSSTPTVNGQLLKLEAFEESYSLAILPDGQRFALGSAWNVWLFDRNGQVLWKKPA
ncbi:MAG TPA: hypothetical protein VN923_02435, partial [Thermoanaerobaculia bacterium]|nr:hypothetical protein [Thermoanaerobaculia bacterium]